MFVLAQERDALLALHKTMSRRNEEATRQEVADLAEKVEALWRLKEEESDDNGPVQSHLIAPPSHLDVAPHRNSVTPLSHLIVPRLESSQPMKGELCNLLVQPPSRWLSLVIPHVPRSRKTA